MWARFTVLNETPIASAIAGCVIPLSRSNTIWMRSRCAAGIFHRSAVFSSRICFLVHLTIRPPESDSQSESYPAPSRDPKKRQKSLDSNSYGSGIRRCHRPVLLSVSAWPIGAVRPNGPAQTWLDVSWLAGAHEYRGSCIMAKKEYHSDQTEGATPFSLIPSAFMTMGRQHIHECVKTHSELVDKF